MVNEEHKQPYLSNQCNVSCLVCLSVLVVGMIVRPSATRSVYTTVDEESGPDIFALNCIIHPDRSRLLLNLSSFSVNICDTKLCLKALIPCHSDRITANTFSVLNNDLFYTSSSDCTAKSWELRVGLTPTSTMSFY